MIGMNLPIFGQKSSGGGGGGPGPADPDFASVVYLSGFNGADGTTATVDESPIGRTMSLGVAGGGGGTTEIDSAVQLFGHNTLYRSSADAPGIYAADSADWNFGSGNYTVEGWFRWTANANGTHLVAQFTTSLSWALRQNTTATLRFSVSSDGSGNVSKPTGSFTPTLNVWYHLAATWDGTTYRLFASPITDTNSTLVASTTTGVTLFNATSLFSIGAGVFDSSFTPQQGFNGHMFDIRVTKGVARYTGTYALPTDKFPRH